MKKHPIETKDEPIPGDDGPVSVPARAPTDNGEMPKIDGFAAGCTAEGCDEASVPVTDERRPEAWKQGTCAKHAQPPAPKRSALAIAIERGWMPADGSRPTSTRDWPNWWRYAAAFGAKPQGWEVTEADFDKAVETATNTIHG